MDNNSDLEKIEKKVAGTIFQDGIFDITLGHVLIAFGIASWLDSYMTEQLNTALGIIIYLGVIIPIWLVHYYVTRPRLGIVRFSVKRRRRNIIVIALVNSVLIISVVIFTLLIVDVIQFKGQGYLFAAIFGLIPLVIFTGLAYFLSFNRLYITGFLFSVGISLKELLTILNLELYGNIIFTSMGVIIVTIGLVCLIRFLKKYPKIEVDSDELRKIGSQQ